MKTNKIQKRKVFKLIAQRYSLNASPRGFGLLEVVIGVAIISLAIFGLLSVAQNSLRVSEYSLREAQAGYLLLEGAEAVRFMRDVSWANIGNLSTSATYYISYSTTANTYATSTVNTFVDGVFSRSFTVADVNRDATSQDIVTPPSGIYDAGTKKITVNVSWYNRNATTTKSLDFYLTNI